MDARPRFRRRRNAGQLLNRVDRRIKAGRRDSRIGAAEADGQLSASPASFNTVVRTPGMKLRSVLLLLNGQLLVRAAEEHRGR